MLCGCKTRKIDLIAYEVSLPVLRNTVQRFKLCELKELRRGRLVRGRENIHSLSEDGEFMLTLTLRFRPGESPIGKREPEVENTQEFSEGQPTPTRILGYKLVGDRFEVIPAEGRHRKAYLYGLSVRLRPYRDLQKLMNDGVTRTVVSGGDR